MRVVSWNVNGLLPTLKDAAHRHSSPSSFFTDVLNADIVCFQEAKIQEEKLERWIACVDGYDSFWAFSKRKKGHSGVVTYVKEDLSPLDARADWFGDEHTIEGLLGEGRLMYTDHGSFVLLNVYVPNAGVREDGRPQLSFKLRFLQALDHLCDKIVNLGKHIVVVGDFNIAHKQKDIHKCWSLEEVYSLEERSWIDHFLTKYVDLFRHFHPDLQDVYSVWDTRTSARVRNEGLRIDYVVCNPNFLMQVEDVEIKKMMTQWSDHAAVFVTMLDQPPLPRHPPPAISSRTMRQFQVDNRQKKLKDLLATQPLKEIKERGTNSKDKAPMSENTGNGLKRTKLDAMDSRGFGSKQDALLGEHASISNQRDFGYDSVDARMKHTISPPLQDLKTSKAFASAKVHKTSKGLSKQVEAHEAHTKMVKQKSLSSFFKSNQLD